MSTEILTESQLAEISDAYRAERNMLLRDCDWTHVTDVVLTVEEKQAWATYRQALRDITSQPDFPYTIDWPTRP